MPRKKTIDLEDIKWKDINTEIVEKKDCFGVSIQFDEALGPEEIKVLRGYYKCNVSSDGLTLTRPVKNSWKGAMMLLISIAYCIHQDKVLRRFWRSVNIMANNVFGDMNIAFKYKYLLSSDITKSLEWEALKKLKFSVDMLEQRLQDKEAYDEKRKQERIDKFQELVEQLPPQENIELVAAPKGWKPLYISCTCKNSHIEKYLAVFGDLLNIDIKRSTIETKYADGAPRSYMDRPTAYQG